MGRLRRNQIELKTIDQVRHMRRADMVVASIHQALRAAAKPGVTTAQLDEVSARVIEKAGAKSNFLGYYGYPATVCISVNDTVVHGIPNDYALREGDLVSFDCGAYIEADGKQWHGDAAFTTIVGGDSAGSEEDRMLSAITEEAMWAAIAATATGSTVGCVGDAVEEVVARRAVENGWEAGIVEEFIGHGIGTKMHMPPDVLNYSVRGRSPKLQPGMVICIEPILTRGSARTRTLSDDWTVKTVDGSKAAHWEHSVAILPEGVCVLSAPDYGAKGLAPYGLIPVRL
ncbi:MAG: type I methionyl aminopeptidase [Actinomycetaceae bacterium]|nr:type I methionyl aminopeptidase [Actinomycetaceae bacterium]